MNTNSFLMMHECSSTAGRRSAATGSGSGECQSVAGGDKKNSGLRQSDDKTSNPPINPPPLNMNNLTAMLPLDEE